MGKNPWIAAFLSFVLAGLGQFYAGRPRRAIIFLALELFTGYLYLEYNVLLGGFLNLSVGLYSIVDAYKIAKEAPVEKPENNDKPDRQYRVY